ncbi:hypothetical protein ACHAWF_012560 [Thalassiosira exigua]
MAQDLKYHAPSSNEKLLPQYPWFAQILTHGATEVEYGESFVPSLGMLANSHLGLENFKYSQMWKFQRWRDGTDSFFSTDSLTEDDEGRGAYTWHGNVQFEAMKDVSIGEEIFVSYGDAWFKAREDLIGVVPGKSQFQEANEMLRNFFSDEDRKGENEADRQAKYEILLQDALDKDNRLRATFPRPVRNVPEALALGTARFSAKDSVRPIEWLEENGACLSNIIAGVSSIPQAGRGAFAARTIRDGERITTTPVLTLEREHLFLWDNMKKAEDGSALQELLGNQLLINYCFGSVHSSLLMFPYSPTVNFINHGGADKSNAEIRWSSLPYHKSDWLHDSLDEMKNKLKTGLLFDIIATRDISRGEEVLLNYGKDWEEKWDQHTKEWPQTNMTERLHLPTIAQMNQIEKYPQVKTAEEEAANPYPSHVMTRCQFKPPESCVPPSQSTDSRCQSRWEPPVNPSNMYPCKILTREPIGQRDWYTAQIEVTSKETNEVTVYLVEYMPRHSIWFVDKPYAKDQYAFGTFRHSIGLPDGIMPEHWLDLNGEEKEGFVFMYENDQGEEGPGLESHE